MSKCEMRKTEKNWALDILTGNGPVSLYFESRNSACLVKAVIEWESAPFRHVVNPPNEWVSIKERQPAPGSRVLATDGIFVGEAYRTSANSWYRHTGFPWRLACGKIVTHWMPLPGLSDKDNNVPTKEQNEPLTIEQLREMDGEPVYVVPANEYSELGKWCVISIGDSDDYSCALVPGVEYWSWKFDGYGEQWLAYRRPPERQDDT